MVLQSAVEACNSVCVCACEAIRPTCEALHAEAPYLPVDRLSYALLGLLGQLALYPFGACKEGSGEGGVS